MCFLFVIFKLIRFSHSVGALPRPISSGSFLKNEFIKNSPSRSRNLTSICPPTPFLFEFTTVMCKYTSYTNNSHYSTTTRIVFYLYDHSLAPIYHIIIKINIISPIALHKIIRYFISDCEKLINVQGFVNILIFAMRFWYTYLYWFLTILKVLVLKE